MKMRYIRSVLLGSSASSVDAINVGLLPSTCLRFVFKGVDEIFGSGIVFVVSALYSTFNKSFDDTKGRRFRYL